MFQEANTNTKVDAFSDLTSQTGGRFGAGIAYQLSNHFGAAVDYYYAYQQTTSLRYDSNSTIYLIDASLNYVGFSLFYTV